MRSIWVLHSKNVMAFQAKLLEIKSDKMIGIDFSNIRRSSKGPAPDSWGRRLLQWPLAFQFEENIKDFSNWTSSLIIVPLPACHILNGWDVMKCPGGTLSAKGGGVGCCRNRRQACCLLGAEATGEAAAPTLGALPSACGFQSMLPSVWLTRDKICYICYRFLQLNYLF